MPRATRYDTDPEFKIPLRSYLIEGLSVAWVLICAGALGCMIAERVNGKLAAQCFCPVERALQ